MESGAQQIAAGPSGRRIPSTTGRVFLVATGYVVAAVTACSPFPSKPRTTNPLSVVEPLVVERSAFCDPGPFAPISAEPRLTCMDVRAAVFGPVQRVVTDVPDLDESSELSACSDGYSMFDAGFHRLHFVDSDSAREAFGEAAECARVAGDHELAALASRAADFATSWPGLSAGDRLAQSRDLLTSIRTERREELFRRGGASDFVENLIIDGQDPQLSIAFARTVAPSTAVRDRILLNAAYTMRHTAPWRHVAALLDALRETEDIALRCNVLAQSLDIAAAHFDGDSRSICDLASRTFSSMEELFNQQVAHDSFDTRSWLSRCWMTTNAGLSRAVDVLPTPERASTSGESDDCNRINLREMQIVMFTSGRIECAAREPVDATRGHLVLEVPPTWECVPYKPTAIVDHGLDLARVGMVSACESALAVARDAGHILRDTDMCGSSAGDVSQPP